MSYAVTCEINCTLKSTQLYFAISFPSCGVVVGLTGNRTFLVHMWSAFYAEFFLTTSLGHFRRRVITLHFFPYKGARTDISSDSARIEYHFETHNILQQAELQR